VPNPDGTLPGAVDQSNLRAGFFTGDHFDKTQGATGITTVAPYIAGQWGRGNNRLPR